MKNALALLGMAVSIIAPLSAHADPETIQSSGHTVANKKTAKTAVVTHARSDRAVVYITNKSVTGSHLPLVVSRYHGEYATLSPIAVYGRPDVDRTGQLNIQGELAQRDPAISVGGAGMLRR